MQLLKLLSAKWFKYFKITEKAGKRSKLFPSMSVHVSSLWVSKGTIWEYSVIEKHGVPQKSMGLNEADTRAKLIDPALLVCGWSENHIKREETAGVIEIVGGKARKIQVGEGTQPIAIALVEAKKEDEMPGKGLEQAKAYQLSDRFHVPFIFSTNGHLYVEFDRTTGLTSQPKPLNQFPSPNALRLRYEAYIGFDLESEAAKPLLTPYVGGEDERRYYQDAAIRAALEKIGRCQT
jgi:type I restriction enzyme, R subunit